MAFSTRTPLISFDAPLIRFRAGNTETAAAPLETLRRFIMVTCFDPEVAPGPDPSTFDLLDFGESYWLVPDGSAERFLDREWASHLEKVNGYFEADAGALPPAWRGSFLGVFKNLYRPRAGVVPAAPLSFLSLRGPLDPARIAQRNRAALSGKQSETPPEK